MSLPREQRQSADALIAAVVISAAVGAALARRGLAAAEGAASIPAALLFAGVIAAIAGAAGGLPWQRPRVWHLVGGVAGGLLLLVGPLLRSGWHPPGLEFWLVAVWMPTISAVAVAEEILFRGVLFKHLEGSLSVHAAMFFTTVTFAIVHLPLYGLGALPLDLAAGLLLGSLRLWSGGVSAPIAAHLVADLALPWV